MPPNLSATTAPGSGDDSTRNYGVGNRWIDTVAKKVYVLCDATVGAAVWKEITAGAAGGEANTASNLGTGAGQVYKQKSGVDLQMRTIKAGTNITVTNNANDITLDATVAAPSLARSFLIMGA